MLHNTTPRKLGFCASSMTAPPLGPIVMCQVEKQEGQVLQIRFPSRSESMVKAYLAGHYTLKEMGQHFGVSYATVSRAVKEIECDM